MLLQTPEGRPLSFYVKKVNPDTLGWKAGIEAGDRIVQVSLISLSFILTDSAQSYVDDEVCISSFQSLAFELRIHEYDLVC